MGAAVAALEEAMDRITNQDEERERRAEELRQFAARPNKRFLVRFIDRDEIDRLAVAPGDDAAALAALECLDIIDWGNGKVCANCAGCMDSEDLELVIHVEYAGQNFERLDCGEVMAVCYGCAHRHDALSIAAIDLHRRYPNARIRCEAIAVGNA